MRKIEENLKIETINTKIQVLYGFYAKNIPYLLNDNKTELSEEVLERISSVENFKSKILELSESLKEILNFIPENFENKEVK